MTIKRSIYYAVTMLVATIGAGTRAAWADFIQNGSFENPSLGGSTSADYTNGYVPGWTGNNNEVEIYQTTSTGLAAYAGTQNVELNGTNYDTISQTVTGLVIGRQYLLTWAYAGRAGAGAQSMNVLFGGSQVANNTATNATAWSSKSAILTATATSEVLSFAAVNVGGSSTLGNELDAVTLNQVAEPASLLILGGAVVGAVVYRRRKTGQR